MSSISARPLNMDNTMTAPKKSGSSMKMWGIVIGVILLLVVIAILVVVILWATGVFGSSTPAQPLPNGSSCSSGSDCSSNNCATFFGGTQGYCQAPGIRYSGILNAYCASNGGDPGCSTNGSLGLTCVNNSCQVVGPGLGQLGTTCTVGTDCNSGNCVQGYCQLPGVTQNGQQYSYCNGTTLNCNNGLNCQNNICQMSS